VPIEELIEYDDGGYVPMTDYYDQWIPDELDAKSDFIRYSGLVLGLLCHNRRSLNSTARSGAGQQNKCHNQSYDPSRF
jgi:hypothetical protein